MPLPVINTGKLDTFKKNIPELLSSIVECNESDDGGGLQKLVRLCGILKSQLVNTEELCYCLEYEHVYNHGQPDTGPLCQECKFPLLMVKRSLVELRKLHKKVVNKKPKKLCSNGIFTTLETMITSKILILQKYPGAPVCSECGQISDEKKFYYQLLIAVHDIILNLLQSATNKPCSNSVACYSCLKYLNIIIEIEIKRCKSRDKTLRSQKPSTSQPKEPSIGKEISTVDLKEKKTEESAEEKIPEYKWAIRQRISTISEILRQLQDEMIKRKQGNQTSKVTSFNASDEHQGGEASTTYTCGVVSFQPNFFREVPSFEEMNLHISLIKRLVITYDFVLPSTVQKLMIKPCVEGRDVIVQAPKHSGKSVGYLIPLIEKLLDVPEKQMQVVIFAPNNTDAIQIYDQLQVLLNGTFDLSYGLFNGSNVKPILDSKPQISIGTFNSILPFFKKHGVGESVQILVFDGCYFTNEKYFKMISSSLETVFPNKVQTIFMKKIIEHMDMKFQDKFMQDPVKILVTNVCRSVKDMKHYVKEADKNLSKLKKLVEVLQSLGDEKAVIYCFSNVYKVCEMLREYNIFAYPLRENESSLVHQNVVNLLKLVSYQAIVSNNTLSKIAKSNHKFIINFGVPSKEVFFERCTYTGNVASVFTITIYKGQKEKELLQEISDHFDIQIYEAPEFYKPLIKK